DLFMGMVFPGLIMSGFYILYILIRCIVRPGDGAKVLVDEVQIAWGEKMRITLSALLPPILLIFAVLGSIMFGWAAPTEAAGMGACGSIILTLCYRTFSFKVLQESLVKTVKVTCMIMLILLGGSMFSGVFIGSGGVALTTELINATHFSPWVTLAMFLGISFLAGFILEWISILLIFVPVFIPIVKVLGFDPAWFCILFLIVIQTSYLTPPMAPAIFYLRGISPPEIKIQDMFRGVIPFIILQIMTLIIVMIFPQTVLWLPAKVLGFN
ncbi:MAG: TRAP transporter large permease subunit, partial [Rhodospirillales bacterium]|nr:TRAP transporter large permease subunit [Rhodospirillales bacterium]